MTSVDTLPRAMLQREYGGSAAPRAKMVGVAQLVERQTVDLDVAGSNPVTHPKLAYESCYLPGGSTRASIFCTERARSAGELSS